ncbi:copper amine oxidase [Wenjunlia tyrosinilytica]|uniref:Amine oxidase n=1 Tax=Wenjunlia tyrosinilytica TaxID=1544741 RepID=A0A917ZUE1_9ACTN|nr:copper amine oxidase [Wenjunlia tyrosinilytica]GGO92242.1 hypothetical protein GCM10012280_41970 [Wenjunlia tyrosinilytica]
MRTTKLRSALGGTAALLLASVTLGGSGSGTAQAAPGTSPKAAPNASAAKCSGRSLIEHKLAGGTTWRMCWRVDPLAGLVLEDVSYQPKREKKPITVLGSAALAQVNVPYDSGKAEYNDITMFGFGREGILMKLDPAECPGGTIRKAFIGNKAHAQNALCVNTQARGTAYRSQDYAKQDGSPGKLFQAQGQDLVLFSVSQVGWYEYINQWIFSDDGTITARVGATGDLSPGDYSKSSDGWPIGKGRSDYATSHYHSVFWRLNFDLDGSPKAKVEQYETKYTGKKGDASAILSTSMSELKKETAANSSLRRWWRVVSTAGRNSDGHPRSWELVQNHSDKYDAHTFTKNDVYFTQYKACEKNANDNQDPACKKARSVDKYVNGEALTNPTMWVNVGFHHIPRDEDQSPMPVHWQGFQLVPRDVTAMSPLTPDERLGNNGHPHEG